MNWYYCWTNQFGFIERGGARVPKIGSFFRPGCNGYWHVRHGYQLFVMPMLRTDP